MFLNIINGENIPDDYDDLTYLSNDHYWNHSIFFIHINKFL
jgi:hypothetical protein